MACAGLDCVQVWIAYLTIEVLLSVVASVEVLTDAVSNTSAAGSDPLLLAPLAHANSEGIHSSLGSSNSLANLVRGNSVAVGTPRVSSVNTLFGAANRATPTSSPRSSSTSLSALAGTGMPAVDEPAGGPEASSGSVTRGSKPAAVSSNAQATTGPGAANAAPRLTRGQSVSLSAPAPAAHPAVAPMSAATVSTVVDVLWRPVLGGLSAALGYCRSRSSHESLMLVLLRGFQSYIFSAGALGEVPARDDFLKVLCEAAVAPAGTEEAGNSGSGGEAQVWYMRVSIQSFYNHA